MNIYQKLQKLRVDLQDLKLKKSGKNQTIKYYELGDLLPAINSLCQKYDLMTRFNIIVDKGQEKAILTVFNASEPQEKIDFVCPTAEVDLPRGQKIQGLGAKITYMRRYMLMSAFEIVESDLLDSINNELDKNSVVSEEDVKRIEETKNLKDLTKLFNEMQSTYKVRLIKDLFTEQRTKLEQDFE